MKSASVRHTLTAYSNDLDQLAKYLLFQYECVAPETANAPMLRSWVVSLVEEGLNPASVNRKMATLRSYYKFLRRRQLITQDPARNLLSLKTKRKLPAFVEEKAMGMLFDEVEFTDDFAGLRDRVILELLYGTGMRLSELLELGVNDVDAEQRLVRVLGKRAKERLIPVTTSLAQLLTQYLAVRAPEENTKSLILTDANKACLRRFYSAYGEKVPFCRYHAPSEKPPRIAAYLCYAPTQPGCRPECHQGIAGPCQPGRYADLHPQFHRKTQKNAPTGASESVNQLPVDR